MMHYALKIGRGSSFATLPLSASQALCQKAMVRKQTGYLRRSGLRLLLLLCLRRNQHVSARWIHFSKAERTVSAHGTGNVVLPRQP